MLGGLPRGLAAAALSMAQRARILSPSFRLTDKLGHGSEMESRHFQVAAPRGAPSSSS